MVSDYNYLTFEKVFGLIPKKPRICPSYYLEQSFIFFLERDSFMNQQAPVFFKVTIQRFVTHAEFFWMNCFIINGIALGFLERPS